MGRYRMRLQDGRVVEADDVKLENGFVKYVPRYTWDETPVKAIPASNVSDIEKIALGWQGGKRFDGSHDSSFSRSPGSL